MLLAGAARRQRCLDFISGRPPRNKGLRYPPDPPCVDEIVAVMRVAGSTPAGVRMRALIVILWRAGLRISEALSLAESDRGPRLGGCLVRVYVDAGFLELTFGRDADDVPGESQPFEHGDQQP